MILKSPLAGLVLLVATASIALAAGAASAQTIKTRVEAAITTIKVLERPRRDNLATIWDGNKYVQCRRMSDRALRCEAAGAVMQVSLARVLTPDHVGRLAAMGWMLDPSFGNYVQTFRPDAPAGDVADKILTALAQGYDADVDRLEIETTSIKSEPCPPRNGPSQNLAGLINDAPSVEAFSVHACAYKRAADAAELALPPGSTATDLIKRYGPQLTAEIGRLRVNIRRDNAYVIFATGLGYVQCATEMGPDAFFCEAQSVESWPALAAVLTPERIARLHAAGFADPGRAQNYRKTYPADTTADEALASEVLTLLHDVYGYYGATALEVKTEEGE